MITRSAGHITLTHRRGSGADLTPHSRSPWRTSIDERYAARPLDDAIADMRPRLLAVARAMRAADPEDIVQTTLEIAIRRSSQLYDPAKLWPWLLKIQTREMFRWSRRIRASTPPHARPVSVVDLDAHTDMRRAIAMLPARTRASIVLHHMADLSIAETAKALGTSENTVKTQLRHGLRRLKESLQ